MSRPAVIHAHNLTRRFGQTLAVDRLSLEVWPGEVVGLLGHNGAGKTTTIRLLNGVLAPESGVVQVLGLSPTEDGSSLRRRTGVVTETPSLEERLTGAENLRYYADLYDVRPGRVQSRIGDLLATFGLVNRAGEKVAGYSRGMKQRLALARALIHEPDLLFLDEPTAGLDPVGARQVHELIMQLSAAEGRTIVMCTHNLNEAQRLCHRVAVMEHGRLLALGTPAELASRWVTRQRLVIEVDPGQVRPARDRLSSLPAAASVSYQANGEFALQGVDREQVPEIVGSLAAAGVRIYRVSPQEATLEDVYFALDSGKAQGPSP